MNLHNIVGPIVAAVNPWVVASVQPSVGYTTSADGSRQPSYGQAVTILVQMQSLQYKDLMQLSGLNIQGEQRALYVSGDWQSIVREDNKGGDLITMPDGSIWLVTLQLENWHMTDGWVKLAITRQMP